MLKTICFFSISVLICNIPQTAIAQIQEFEFGVISDEDLKMEVYPLDSGADAVYLLRYGSSSYDYTTRTFSLNVHVRLKVLKESGLEWGDLELSYFRSINPFKNLKAATYNWVDGEMVTTNVSKKEWVDEKYNDRLRTKKLSFPDVRIGSIIEYSYSQIVSVGAVPPWIFQSSIPTIYTEYKSPILQSGRNKPNLQTYVQPSYTDNTSSRFHVAMKDVPALKNEPFVASIENFRAKVVFENLSGKRVADNKGSASGDWAYLNKLMLEHAGQGVALRELYSIERIYPVEKEWTNNEQSLQEIYRYVRDHFKWNKIGSVVINENFRKLWKEGEGDAADINLTLGAFLKHAGIKVNPVMLSTRPNGYLKKFFLQFGQFNYVVICATIGDKKFLLDATEKFRPFNVLPERAINGDGLLISEEGPRWIDMRWNKEMSSKTVSTVSRFNRDLLIEGEAELDFRGITATQMRISLNNEVEKSDGIDEDGEEKGKSLDDYKIGEVSDLIVENLDDPDQNLKAKYRFSMEDGIEFVGDRIFLSPIFIKHISENPLKAEKRLYPIELVAPVADTYLFKINIPEGYQVEELPEPQNILLPNDGGRYMYNIGQLDGYVQVMVRLNLKNTVYLPEDYGNLKELFNLIISKQAEQIVLVKK